MWLLPTLSAVTSEMGGELSSMLVMCRWPYHTTTLYLVPLCSSVQFWLLSSVSPPLLLLPNVLPHTTLTWIPVKLSSCPECGWADPDPFTCFLPYYCCSVTERQEGSSQPLPGKICELVEQFEGQPSGESTGGRQSRTAFLYTQTCPVSL